LGAQFRGEALVIKALKRQARRSLALKRLYLWYARRRQEQPPWPALIAGDRELWQAALPSAQNGPQVLVATSIGGYPGMAAVEQVLAAALTLRGANVHVLLCDEALPACMFCQTALYPNMKQFVRYGPSRDICKSCFKPAAAAYRPFGLTVHRYSDFITAADRENAASISAALPLEEVSAYRLDGLAVGEHALAGALRFFARGDLAGEAYAGPVLRRYLEAALLTAFATRRLLGKYDFRSAVFHHGIYVPQGIIGEVCRHAGRRVVNWNPAYRKRCFIFSHGDTYHHTLMAEPVSAWENIPWSPALETELLDYLKSRWQGTNDWIWFHEKPREDLDYIARQTGVDFTKPVIGLLTNVIWDAQLHYPANAFPNLREWLLKTVAYFSRRPELQLLIRVHPAEIRGAVPSRQLAVDEINKAFPEMPKNVFIIPPESEISTYAAMMPCDAVIIFGTKTGVELASLGMRVIVAGEAWVRNKGITLDAVSEADYFRLLDRLPLGQPLDAAAVRRARLYAYHFFFRRMIPLDFMEPAAGNPPFRVNLAALAGLSPGRSGGLDVICRGILEGTDFIYPAEQLAH
jgi:hypothetical protein